MSVLPKDIIKCIAETVGVSALGDELASALAADVEYRVREICQVLKLMVHFFIGFHRKL